jgi:hypothetical protein
MLNKIAVLLFCILIFSVQRSYSQTSSPASKKQVTPVKKVTVDSTECYLELRGNVRHLKGNESEKSSIKPLDSALITIYYGDIPYSEIWTNKKGKCSFKLPPDKNFKIEISKNGFVTKSIAVNTKIPPEKRDTYTFNFDVDLFEVVKGLDVSVLNNPIAKVSYHLGDENFGYDVAYTSKINADLKKMYKNYYRLQKIEADSALFQIDSTTITTQKK